MGVGMGSRKKPNSGGVVVSCVVLGLALLAVQAAARKIIPECLAECDGKWDHRGCMIGCINGVKLLAAHGGEEARGGGGEVGLQAEVAGWEEDLRVCQSECAPKFDPSSSVYPVCIRNCMMHRMRRGIEGEEARGGGEVGLRAEVAGWEEDLRICQSECAPKFDPSSSVYHVCIRNCMMHHLRQGVEGEEARGGRGEVGLQAEVAEWEEDLRVCQSKCAPKFDPSSSVYHVCIRNCMMHRLHHGVEGEEARGGRGEVGLRAEVTGWEEDLHVCQSECAPKFDPSSSVYHVCIRNCMMHRVRRGIEGVKARARDGGVGLLATPVERVRLEEEEEYKSKQEDIPST